MIKFLPFIFIIIIFTNSFSQQNDNIIYLDKAKDFYPQNLTVEVDQEIIFHSAEGKHQISIQSENVNWNARLDKTKPEIKLNIYESGEYKYFCKNHKHETGIITVKKILKVELKSFNAEYLEHQILIKWQTLSEVENLGFDLERREENSDEWRIISSIPGENNFKSTSDYKFSDEDISDGKKYFYRLKQKSFSGEINYSKEIEISSSGKGNYRLFQNYPNPFNPVTKISYSLPRQGFVSLKVYNALGNEVATLLNEEQNAGMHEIFFDGSTLPTGVYYLQMTSNDYKQIIKMILLR